MEDKPKDGNWGSNGARVRGKGGKKENCGAITS